MKVKEVWTDNDFEEMGWHDSYIHAISFPYDTLDLSLDIDYLFKWVFDDKDNMYDFWVSPCTLTFVNVLDIKIELNFQNSIGLYIVAILRDNPRLSANGKMTIWDFKIETDKGHINFKSTGYKQVVKQQPLFSMSQVLFRDR